LKIETEKEQQRVFLSIEYCILGAVFENFSYFITTSIYSYNPIADVYGLKKYESRYAGKKGIK